jgi:hypothetical protein
VSALTPAQFVAFLNHSERAVEVIGLVININAKTPEQAAAARTAYLAWLDQEVMHRRTYAAATPNHPKEF